MESISKEEKMKTLDEVIKRIEIYKNIFDKNGCFECHYHEDDCIDSCFLENVLYYLKTIETTENLYHDAVNELSKWKNEDWKDRYLPLTWDELKQMGGKPVWIEYMDDEQQTGWALIAKNPERPVFGKPKLFTLVREDGKFYLTISGYGKRWQAYRKKKI